MTNEEIQEILKSHLKWLNGEPDGKRAVLVGADLSRANLQYANLTGADLSGANLNRTYLYKANISEAELLYADLNKAILDGADLQYTDLRNANLSEANISGTNLRGADLRGANLENIYYDNSTLFYTSSCPEKGSFIGFKKCGKYIVELRITENAKRCSATSRKCRCSEAEVLSITNIDGTSADISSVSSNFDPNFVYKIGEIVHVDDFDEDRWNECSSGIHFFIIRDEAVRFIY